MPTNPISRRDILRTLAMGAVGGSVLQVIPLAAAEQAHRMVKREKSQSPAGTYKPKFFPAHQFATLRVLCDQIIPADEQSGGAIQAGAPEFIDLLTSENKDYQVDLGGGLMWIDGFCGDRFDSTYLQCSTDQQKQVLDLIAYRKNAENDLGLRQGVEFFAFLRKLTTDGFYSSEIGIADLQYQGNTFLREFPGCPPVPEV
jgi:gluconate 2-dehydrogenase gamma chain